MNEQHSIRNKLETQPLTEVLKNTHKKKALSNITPAPTKGANMGIWVIGTSNQLFIRGSSETKFSKK